MLYTASTFGALPHRITDRGKWNSHAGLSLKTVLNSAQCLGAFAHALGSLLTCSLVKKAL